MDQFLNDHPIIDMAVAMGFLLLWMFPMVPVMAVASAVRYVRKKKGFVDGERKQ